MEPGHWLSGAAARHPDRTAVETPDGSATYQELLRRARGAAGALERRGARRREPVALALAPGLEFVETLHGCLLLGAPALPVDPRLGERERTALLRDATLVVDRPLDLAHEPALPPPPAGDDVALVIHTSGTTGAPEPVGLTFGNVRANAEGLARTLELRDDERWLCPLPLSHVGGLMILLRSVLMGTTAVLAPPSAAAGDAIGLVSLVPTQLQRLLDAGATPGPQLRRVLLGGGPMPPALLERAASAGWPVSASYGLTQACSTVTVAEPGDTATAGRPLPGVHVGVAPDGEILVSGPTVSGGGTLHTGDLGRLDAQGRLVVTGRRRDLIVSGGENVAPAEVEAVLSEHPDVTEVAVFARADPVWGEAVTALVVLRADSATTPENLREHCRARLAPFKVPKAIERVDVLPRTASGKVRRADLR